MRSVRDSKLNNRDISTLYKRPLYENLNNKKTQIKLKMLKSLSLASVLSVSQAVQLEQCCMTCPTACDDNEEHKELEPEVEEDIEEEMEEVVDEVIENIEELLEETPEPEIHVDPIVVDPKPLPEPVIDPPVIVDPIIEPEPKPEPIVDPPVVVDPIIEPEPKPEPIVDPPVSVDPIIEPEPMPEPEIEPIEEPIPEPVIELDPIEPLHATLWTELGCTGQSHKIYVNEDGSPYNMDYAEIITTSIGDNSLSSLQVPKGWEILAWQHDFYGETRLF